MTENSIIECKDLHDCSKISDLSKKARYEILKYENE